MEDVISKDNAAYLRPVRTDESRTAERTRLLLAINEAEQLGFDNTKDALVFMLHQHEEQTTCI